MLPQDRAGGREKVSFLSCWWMHLCRPCSIPPGLWLRVIERLIGGVHSLLHGLITCGDHRDALGRALAV